MLQWIKNTYSRIFLDRHRLLFRYWDGQRFVREDPFVLFRRLMTSGDFNPDDALKKLSIPDPKVILKALEEISEASQKVFNVKPLDQGGLSELECVNLLRTFVDWMSQLKKNGGMSLTSAFSTTQPSSSQQQKQNGTNKRSGSTSTG